MIQAFIKQSIARSPALSPLLALGLLLVLQSSVAAQQLYHPEPVRISKAGSVDQLVNGSSNAGTQKPNPPASQDPEAELTQQAVYQQTSPRQDDWDRILNTTPLSAGETLTTKREPQSFIERETDDAENRETARDLVTRISINLVFVLAIALGFILLARQWQKSKLIQRVTPAAELESLVVRQVLPLTSGASLHVVEGFGNKCLVAIDASGIKSVNVLTRTFEETLEDTDELEETVEAEPPEPIVADQSSSEIDENLIRLLLQSSKKAA